MNEKTTRLLVLKLPEPLERLMLEVESWDKYRDIDWKKVALEGLERRLEEIADTVIYTARPDAPKKLVDLTPHDAEVIRKADEAWTHMTKFWPYLRELAARPPAGVGSPTMYQVWDACLHAVYWEARRRWMEEERGATSSDP